MNSCLVDCCHGFSQYEYLPIGLLYVLCSDILQYRLSLLCMSLQFVTRHFFLLSFIHIAYPFQLYCYAFYTLLVSFQFSCRCVLFCSNLQFIAPNPYLNIGTSNAPVAIILFLAESCLIGCSEIAHRSLDHEQERAIKGQMHAILKPFNFVIHGCDPLECGEHCTCREVYNSNSDNRDLFYWYVVCYYNIIFQWHLQFVFLV